MNKHLTAINANIYRKLSIQITDFNLEAESKEYDASQFSLGDLKLIDRTAKVTPKKIGQFVTFWKRIAQGPITPFDQEDCFDFFTVTCTRDELFGQFVFPKSVLIQKSILSTITKEGKRAFRVYPSWDTPKSKQAIKTQSWQLEFFYLVGETNTLEKASELLGLA